jgi:hypothetical protein
MTKDITITLDSHTVTTAIITILTDPDVQGDSQYGIWYDFASWNDERRVGYKYFGGHCAVSALPQDLDTGGLRPNTTYYMRVFEIKSGSPMAPLESQHYSNEIVFTTNETVSSPRIHGHFCSETPTDTARQGPQVTNESTSIRIGATNVDLGIDGTSINKVTCLWWLENSNTIGSLIKEDGISDDTEPYNDFSVSDLPIGHIINYKIEVEVNQGAGGTITTFVEGYTHIFSEEKGDALIPAEIIAQEAWASMRPGVVKITADGPICYFAGTVRNNSLVGIPNAIVKYGIRTDPVDKLFYVITESGAGEGQVGTFIVDGEHSPIMATSFDTSLDLVFTSPMARWNHNEQYDEDNATHVNTYINLWPSHKCKNTSIVATSAQSTLKFNQGIHPLPVLCNNSYSNFEPDHILLRFDLDDGFDYRSGIIRSYIKLYSNNARIDKSLQSTVFVMACDSSGDILVDSNNEPVAFNSTHIAMIGSVVHTIPVENIIQYYLDRDSQNPIYIRLQLGSSFEQDEHSGPETEGDTGYVDFWEIYGKLYQDENSTWLHDVSYAPTLEIFHTENFQHVSTANGLPSVDITDINSIPFIYQSYEFSKWNGINFIDDIHDLVSSYMNTISFTQNSGIQKILQPDTIDSEWRPVYLILRFGGFWEHSLQEGMAINGMIDLTENLGINELIPGLLYTGDYPSSFICVGGFIPDYTEPITGWDSESYVYIDKNSGRFGDFNDDGVRQTTVTGVSSGVDAGETLHYYYSIVQHGIWASPGADWEILFSRAYGSTSNETSRQENGLFIFDGHQIDQQRIRQLVAGTRIEPRDPGSVYGGVNT